MVYVAQLTQKGEIVYFCSNQFFIRDLNKGQSVVVGGFLDPKDSLYKFHDMT
jgi:hypothetical protein